MSEFRFRIGYPISRLMRIGPVGPPDLRGTTGLSGLRHLRARCSSTAQAFKVSGRAPAALPCILRGAESTGGVAVGRSTRRPRGGARRPSGVAPPTLKRARGSVRGARTRKWLRRPKVRQCRLDGGWVHGGRYPGLVKAAPRRRTASESSAAATQVAPRGMLTGGALLASAGEAPRIDSSLRSSDVVARPRRLPRRVRNWSRSARSIVCSIPERPSGSCDAPRRGIGEVGDRVPRWPASLTGYVTSAASRTGSSVSVCPECPKSGCRQCTLRVCCF